MKKFYLVVVLIFLILLFGYIMFKSNNYSKPVIKETYSELLGTIYKKIIMIILLEIIKVCFIVLI